MGPNVRGRVMVVLSALTVLLCVPKLHAQSHVAFVDLQRALTETDDGQRAQRSLQQLVERRQQSLDQAADALNQMNEHIQRRKSVLSREALEEHLDAYHRAFVQLQSSYVEFRREIADSEARLTQSIVARIRSIAHEISESKGFTLVIGTSGTEPSGEQPTHDLTDQVIERYNEPRQFEFQIGTAF